MPRIAVVFFDAGGGHRAAAQALFEIIGVRHKSWSVELLNLDDVLQPVDPCYRITGMRGSDWYNFSLRLGWAFASGMLTPLNRTINRVLRPLQTRLLAKCWRRIRPDLVVSLIPHFSAALYQSLRAENREIPFVTVLTDFADCPPHFWIENQEQHFICGTDRAASQAADLSPHARVWQVSGMLLHPLFYAARSGSKAAGRRRLGLEADRATAVVLFGGQGSRQMLGIARRLASCPVQAIFLCGRNPRLADRLRSMHLPYPAHVEGFTKNVADFMALGDFFIGKAGPGSLSEALRMGLPTIVESNFRTLVQERYNVEWIRDGGYGLAVSSFRQLPDAIHQLLDTGLLQMSQRRIQKLNNRAIFEVPEILNSILEERNAGQDLLSASLHE